MEQDVVSLTIHGAPSEAVRVVYRSNADPQPPPIWEGRLNENGEVTVQVPRAYLVVIGDGRQSVLRLQDSNDNTYTIRWN